MVITPAVIPSVSIALSPANNICLGTPVSFTASSVNGGALPVYQWQKNGNNVGSNNALYTDAALASGDIITCLMTGNASCSALPSVASNALTMVITPAVTPSVSIASSPVNNICLGTPVSLTASPVN